MINKILLENNSYNITKKTASFIFIIPILIFLIQCLIILFPITRDFGFWMLEENKPIEISTFILFIIGGIFGVYFSIGIFKYKTNRLQAYFFLVFSIFLIIIGMEEISWGQQFFHFETPEKLKEINLQGETTLHNIGFMQTHSDTLHLVIGLAGIIGIKLKNHFFFNKLNVPIILISWFGIIFLQSSLDVIVDVINVKKSYNYSIQRLSELIELIIAGVSFLYLWLNKRKYK